MLSAFWRVFLAIGRVALWTLVVAAAGTPLPISAQSDLRIERDAKRRTLTLEVGPVALPANLGYHAPFVPVAVPGRWDIDGWLRAFDVELVDGGGRTMSTPLLHHAGLLAPGERDLFNTVTRRIVAFGMETASIQLPGRLGYRVEPGDSVVVVGGFFNPTAVAFDEVYMRIHIIYADARFDARHESVLPFFLDTVPAGQTSFEVPPGGGEQSWEWQPAVAGRVLAVGGHIHQHGVSVTLEDATTNEVLFTGAAEYDASGTLTGVSREVFARGFRIDPERMYRVTASYRNPTRAPIVGAMGHVAGLFLPDSIDDMPPADPNDPAYVADLYGKLNGSVEGHDHGGHGAH